VCIALLHPPTPGGFGADAAWLWLRVRVDA